jgi:SAM-dependent methyltransferase
LGSGVAPYADLFGHRHYVTADLLTKADVRCDATILPFAGGCFDLVLCTEVLEHVPDPDATLKEIHRTLKQDGALVLTTPLTWGIHEARDFHRWTESGLRQLLQRNGFATLQIKPRGGVLLCLGALLLIVPWQLLGDSRQRSGWQSILFALLYISAMPLALVFSALDRLDRTQHFTQGYVVLSRRG